MGTRCDKGGRAGGGEQRRDSLDRENIPNVAIGRNTLKKRKRTSTSRKNTQDAYLKVKTKKDKNGQEHGERSA